MRQFSHSELAKAINVLLYGESDDTLLAPEDHISEIPIILACVAALPHTEQYVVYDAEGDDEISARVLDLPETKVASWDGSAPHSSGYGWVCQIATSAGIGLAVSLGGSSLQSASGFWILPARAAELHA